MATGVKEACVKATRNDYVLFAIAIGAKEEEAAKALEIFMSNEVRNLCIEKRTSVCEKSRPQKRDVKSRLGRGRLFVLKPPGKPKGKEQDPLTI